MQVLVWEALAAEQESIKREVTLELTAERVLFVKRMVQDELGKRMAESGFWAQAQAQSCPLTLAMVQQVAEAMVPQVLLDPKGDVFRTL